MEIWKDGAWLTIPEGVTIIKDAATGKLYKIVTVDGVIGLEEV